VREVDLESLWDAGLAVLRRHDFQPDRQDRALGVITTLPATSRQWGEFWRQDVADPYSFLQASLQTIRRQVTVRFLRRGQDYWDIDVQVDVFRQCRPESQITTASSAYQAFSGVLPTYEGGLQVVGKPEVWWAPIGRDGAMEARLLNLILDRAGSEPPAEIVDGPSET